MYNLICNDGQHIEDNTNDNEIMKPVRFTLQMQIIRLVQRYIHICVAAATRDVIMYTYR